MKRVPFLGHSYRIAKLEMGQEIFLNFRLEELVLNYQEYLKTMISFTLKLIELNFRQIS